MVRCQNFIISFSSPRVNGDELSGHFSHPDALLVTLCRSINEFIVPSGRLIGLEFVTYNHILTNKKGDIVQYVWYQFDKSADTLLCPSLDVYIVPNGRTGWVWAWHRRLKFRTTSANSQAPRDRERTLVIKPGCLHYAY
jgi:hypothetical protein